MNTKKPTTRLFLALALLCLVGNASEAKDSRQQGGKPNVLFIAVDDMNDWNGVLKGNPQARTPHLDKLASRGMAFTNAHCAAPACGPSKSALMSGIEELYDHEKDRWEWQNHADNPEYAEVKKAMRKELPTHHEPDGVTYDLPGRNRTE